MDSFPSEVISLASYHITDQMCTISLGMTSNVIVPCIPSQNSRSCHLTVSGSKFSKLEADWYVTDIIHVSNVSRLITFFAAFSSGYYPVP